MSKMARLAGQLRASPWLVSTLCPNDQDLQSKNVTDSQWDSHGQNGQDFPLETVWGLP